MGRFANRALMFGIERDTMRQDTIYDRLMTRAISAGLISNCGKVRGLPIHIGWLGISYYSDARRGYASLGRNDGTRWHWSTEKAHGLWSLSVHVPIARLEVIGPFSKA